MKNKIIRTWKYLREFNFPCFIFYLLSNIIPCEKVGNGISWYLLQKKHNSIIKYLSRYYYAALQEEKNHSYNTINEKNKKNIWTAWFQGEDNEPEVIQLTIASIRKYANLHEVIVLTDDNISDYLDVPDNLQQKYRKGTIGKAAYADLIRLMVLAKYGGIWVDATILLNDPFDEKCYDLPFYSIGVDDDKSQYISSNRWIAGIIGSKVNSKYSFILSTMFNQYWTEHELYIDYFIIDYLITLIYINDEDFRKTVDSFRKMQFHTNKIKEIINKPYDEVCLMNLLPKGQMYSLTYREKYYLETPDGELTNYGFLYNTIIEKEN